MRFIEELNSVIVEKQSDIENWIKDHISKVKIPLYSSVDIRISDFKIAPVDTNIFPAGFNNLSERYKERAGELFKEAIEAKYSGVKTILIVPELHTKNKFYWENIYALKTILKWVGYYVKVGIVSEEFMDDYADFETESGKRVRAFKVKRQGRRVVLEGYDPDLILINNDFSDKCPKVLRDIEQPVVPPIEIGWHTRKKNVHFDFYNSLALEISKLLEIDPWTISIDTRFEEDVDFDNREDRVRVSHTVESLLHDMSKEYLKRGIKQQPRVFIKSNYGTYGMAVISVSDPQQIVNLNAEGRKRMRVSKGGKPVRDVVIQEAIPTALILEDKGAVEPVIYMVEDKLAGIFYRCNKKKNEYENLNSRGMEFCPTLGDFSEEVSPSYVLVSRIAAVAAGFEIEKILKEGGCKD